MELNQAAEALRAAKLLGRSASSLKLFKKYPELFALTPEKRPSKVQYLGAAAERERDGWRSGSTRWTRAPWFAPWRDGRAAVAQRHGAGAARAA